MRGFWKTAILGAMLAGCTGADGGPVNLTPWRKLPPLARSLTADPTRPPREAAPEERELIEAAVAEALEAPSSPLFGAAMTIFGSMAGAGKPMETWLVCGEASAGNDSGGHKRPQLFLASLTREQGRSFARLQDIGEGAPERQKIIRVCRAAGVAL